MRAVSIVYRRDSLEVQMTTAFKRARLIAVVSTLIVAAACGSNEGSMDESLKRDLASLAGNSVELAPRAQSSQLVISPVEAARASAPATASRKVAPKASSRAPSPVASAPAPEHSAPTQTTERRTVTSPSAAEPAPLPPLSRPPTQRQSGTYKTEAEVFRQMPWIKP